jgi:hypothetical protein
MNRFGSKRYGVENRASRICRTTCRFVQNCAMREVSVSINRSAAVHIVSQFWFHVLRIRHDDSCSFRLSGIVWSNQVLEHLGFDISWLGASADLLVFITCSCENIAPCRNRESWKSGLFWWVVLLIVQIVVHIVCDDI